MAQCQLCKREFGRLKYVTDHIKVCSRCVNSLNELCEPAIHAQNRLGEMLARGMERNALHDLESSDGWIRQKARWTLDNFEAAYQRALSGWLNRCLAGYDNTTRDFKTVRAYRRGILRFDGGRPWSYPSNWREVAAAIRTRDGCACKSCGAEGVMLDVHHIIYLSNYGTNQQSNLVTLCRTCHETEHDRVFDFGEPDDPEAPSPMQPKPESRAPVKPMPAPAEVSVSHEVLAPPKVRSFTSPTTSPFQPENQVCPRCGGTCKEESPLTAGNVLRCTDCGFMPRLQIDDLHFPEFESKVGLCEGAFVLEKMAQAMSPREDQSVQCTVIPHARPESIPATDEKPGQWVLIPVALILGLVVIVVVVMGMQ